jgi:hypothetical protein
MEGSSRGVSAKLGHDKTNEAHGEEQNSEYRHLKVSGIRGQGNSFIQRDMWVCFPESPDTCLD